MSDGIERSIGRLEGKIDLVIGDVSELKVAFNTLEAGRLSRLERDFANFTGKMTIVAALASVGVSFAFWLLNKFFP